MRLFFSGSAAAVGQHAGPGSNTGQKTIVKHAHPTAYLPRHARRSIAGSSMYSWLGVSRGASSWYCCWCNYSIALVVTQLFGLPLETRKELCFK